MLIRYLSITLIIGLVATYFSSSLWPLVISGFIVGLSSNITQLTSSSGIIINHS
ncbi:hypothetical protein ACLKMH_06240 [Psychromonas sp. KJ10-10]|uniref:hypothetical protein n=1 Tax=Psychromonas sp. KJ10-10 TaxID=3391823 RepID=UPI0039B3976F